MTCYLTDQSNFRKVNRMLTGVCCDDLLFQSPDIASIFFIEEVAYHTCTQKVF